MRGFSQYRLNIAERYGKIIKKSTAELIFMDIKKIISELTTEEKAILLTGATSMTTAEIPRLGIESRKMADGTAGVRAEK